MTHALQIDTLEFSKKLKAAGADERLAEAIVQGLTAADTSSLATKADLAEVRTEITEVRAEITGVRAEIAGVKAELKTDIAGVKTEIAEVRAEIAGVKTDLLKYMIAMFVTQLTVMIALFKLFS